MEKVYNLDFFEFGKDWKLNDPHPLTNWEKFEIEIIILKHLILPENHFETYLSFVQLKHVKSTFTFRKI